MADQKISQLSDGGNALATDEYVVARSGQNFRIDGASVAASATSVGTLASLTVTGTATIGTVAATNITGGVQQADLGSAPNEIPLNQYLGMMAFRDDIFYPVTAGTGITAGVGTVYGGAVSLQGGTKRVNILIDLTGLNSGGTAGDIIGVNGTANPCHIGQLPSMTVLGGRMTCLEVPAGSDDDLDLYSATEGTGVEDQAITALTETQLVDAGGAWTLGLQKVFIADPTSAAFLYLVGQETGNATYTAGRFLIEVYGV